MKYIFTYILFIVACIFISCGQSEKEKAAIQQKHDDSIKTATENEVLWKIKSENDSAARAKVFIDSIKTVEKRHDDSIVNTTKASMKKKELLDQLTNQYITLQNQLKSYDAQIIGLNNKLANDQQFHFGVGRSTKEERIKNDQLQIENVNARKENIRILMYEINNRIQRLK